MFIRLGYDVALSCAQPTEFVSLLDVHPDCAEQVRAQSDLHTAPAVETTVYLDSYGNACRRLSVPAGELRLSRDVVVEHSGAPDPVDPGAREVPVHDLPGEILEFLLPSRYCETDLMMDLAWREFGALAPGWDRVQAIFGYAHRRLTFGYAFARATRTAAQAHEERVGVCRDFAHLAVTLCRCMNIPARYANGYMGDIGVPADPAPMDFNAWCEVYLEDRWFTLDARHNHPRIGRVVVARGRDAADVPLLHSFGPHRLKSFKVWTFEQDMPHLTALP
ncbi:transglutaminase-like domain-containing protein [Paenirhodobacter sp.]|uniref:transglutaminase-like domain-containing protein n=1 Tax=Paenirhodobacter sp. TaxID=1965326 RepID=UPI003B425FD3